MASARRSVKEGNRERIVEAGRELFSRRGYRGTTTRDLAVAAGVAEPTLFRHFAGKAELFDVAVVEPVHQFLEQFVARHRQIPIGSRDVTEATRAFFGELYDELVRDRRLLIALVAALTFEESDGELAGRVRPTLRDLLTGLDEHFAREFEARGFAVSAHVALRIMFGAVLGVVVHDDWLFDSDQPARRDELVDAMTHIAVRGLTG